MGTWSTSITGNDTAADLRSEYQAAFYYNDAITALQKIDNYVRKEGLNESDEETWADYFYSLANFMWDKGILTDTIKTEAIRLIDSGFGLDVWVEAGQKLFEKRKEILRQFRQKILSPQPPKKKITVNLYTKPIFEIGDVVAFQLQTADKIYIPNNVDDWWGYKISEERFRAFDGKYIAVRKVDNIISYISSIEPAVRDIWPIFQLYDKVFDSVPKLDDVINIDFVEFRKTTTPSPIVYKSFWCEGSMFYFKRRKHVILGNHQDGIDVLEENSRSVSIDFGISNDCTNADKDLLNALSI